MKKYILTCLIILGIAGTASASWYNPFSWFQKEVQIQEEINLGALPFFTQTGSLLPGSDTVNNNIGTTSPSNLRYNGFFKNLQIDGTCTGCSSGASADWLKETNYGVLNLTASTTIPYWAKDAFYASSTSVFQGLATFGNASTSQISATNSYLGTVLSGTWNGTAIGNSYVDDDITLTNLTQITNRAISDTSGTLTVARGGTGQTSFGQGWLNSDGTTLTSSTSPTVAYLTATSTATSTFAGSLAITETNATSTFAGGVDISDGCFAIDGTCLATGAGTVTSVDMSVPTGLTISGNPITTSGTLALTYTAGYAGVLTASTTNWNGFYDTPSTRITDGTGLTWSTNTLNCDTASGSVQGCLASADWTTFNGKQAGDATLTALAGLTISAGSLITGTGADAFSVLAGGTNGYVLAMSGSAPAWVATTTLSTISGTLDISSQSNLTCGTNCTLTGDDISVDDAFILNTGDIGTGVYDFGGATSVEIPNGASPTVDTTGEIGIDTTSGQFKWSYNGSTLGVGVPFYTLGFSYSTTSWTGTTTIFLAPAKAAQTFVDVACETSVGTLGLSLYDGTNRADYIPTASTTINTNVYSTNNTFTANESRRVDIGTPASSPVKIACNFKYTYDQD